MPSSAPATATIQVFAAHFHQDCVLTDALDAAPGDDNFLLFGQTAKNAVGSGNDQCRDPTGIGIKPEIARITQFFPTAQIDDLHLAECGCGDFRHMLASPPFSIVEYATVYVVTMG